MKANKLKKITAVFFALVCAVCSVITCSAAGQKYTIGEIDDMIINLPEDMSAITRSSKDTDRYFSVFGLDYNTTMENFKNGDIYLQGMDSSSAITVTVTMTKTDESRGIGNYNLLESDKLSQVSSNFLNQDEYNSCTPDSVGKIVWLNFDTTVISNGLSIRAYQANTVYDGMSVSITLQRNSGNVTADDYNTFSEIVSSVNFLTESSSGKIIPYIIIGAAVLLILIIILIIVIVKRTKKHRRKSKNDKIIEELADKYASKHKNHYEHTENESDKYRFESHEKDKEDDLKTSSDYGKNLSNKDDSDEFYSGVDRKRIEDVKAYKSKDKESDEKEIDEILDYKHRVDEKNALEQDKAEVVYSNEKNSENEQSVPTDTEVESKPTEQAGKPKELEERLFGKADENDEEDYNNDEELVREEAKKVKFKDSDDFFEEAPKKTIGVISSREVKEAEDFDVINEVEKRAKEVERPSADTVKSFSETAKKVAGGVKSFCTHFGYFCTNLSRMIKRRRAANKRRKAEEARRERARQRAERQKMQNRQAASNGGLVQVHSRNDKRPVQQRRSVSSKRINQSGQKRLQGSQNQGNRRR